MKSLRMYLYLRKNGKGRLQSLNITRKAAFFNEWIGFDENSHSRNRLVRIRYARKKIRGES